MIWKLSLSIAAVTVGSLLVAACVGESTAPPAAAQGDLNGPCFVNGTCNAGLSCGVVKGAATCVPAGDASPGDSSDDGSATDAAEAGLPVCSLTPTPFPCTGSGSGTACYGTTQTCSLTGCSGADDLMWSCFSPNQCSTLACCLSANSAVLNPNKDCSQGALAMLPGATTGTTCATGKKCADGETQLCQFNSQCPAGQFCSVIKVVSKGDAGSPSLNGAVLGVCASP